MTPDARAHLDKAQQSLSNSRIVLSVNLAGEAGRLAYIAAFHAAQALIVERTGTTPKTHSGVHSHFGKLAKNDPYFDIELRRFLSQAYEIKTIADYDVTTVADLPTGRAVAAVATANAS